MLKKNIILNYKCNYLVYELKEKINSNYELL